MDSCRFDSFIKARTPNFDRLGVADCRWSYASWTAPSHYAFLMGLMPHVSPQHVFASEVYKKEFVSWVDRLDIPDLSFKTFLPEISLPKVLSGLGYRCTARVSMPVLNNFTLLAKYFDDYKLMANHNDFAGMVEEISFTSEQPQFYFLNLGETHYPYMLSGEDLPHIHGVHGVFKNLAEDRNQTPISQNGHSNFFDDKVMATLHQQQVSCVEYIDNLAGKLLQKCPANTYFIVTADHGELFGEQGYFGHGPIMHEKVFQVPFLEGKRPLLSSQIERDIV
jgi:hypothetical protein